MNDANLELAKRLVRPSYVSQGAQGLAARQKLLTSLLSERRLPERGWDEAQLELLVRDAAALDSNNFLANVGAGEREARVACPLVARRHFGLAHGIGRSGDISAEQPKAAGSTLLARLCNLLAADALAAAGLDGLGDSTVLPVATGMALTLALLALAGQRPGARRVQPRRAPLQAPLTSPQVRGLAALRPEDVREGHPGGGAGGGCGGQPGGGRPGAHRPGRCARRGGPAGRGRGGVRALHHLLLRAARAGPGCGAGTAVRGT